MDRLNHALHYLRQPNNVQVDHALDYWNDHNNVPKMNTNKESANINNHLMMKNQSMSNLHIGRILLKERQCCNNRWNNLLITPLIIFLSGMNGLSFIACIFPGFRHFYTFFSHSFWKCCLESLIFKVDIHSTDCLNPVSFTFIRSRVISCDISTILGISFNIYSRLRE